MQKITPFLWYDGKAEEAVRFYNAAFPDLRTISMMRYGEAGPGPKGAVMSVTFEIQGQQFIAFNGGPQFQFTPAISLFVNCRTQSEVDTLWEKLSDGGQQHSCGWLQDRFGVSWQIVPEGLRELIQGHDPEKSKRVMQAMFQMKKLDIDALRRAHDAT